MRAVEDGDERRREMKGKPILFSTPMVQAILEGRKTQTRRVVKPQPKYELRPHRGGWNEYSENPPADSVCNSPWGMGRIPEYNVGDILWVREIFQAWGRWETYTQNGKEKRRFVDMTDNDHPYRFWGNFWIPQPEDTEITYYTRPSIFMPRKAARIFLEVKNVRVERVQDITDEDAYSEGIDSEDEDYCIGERYTAAGMTPAEGSLERFAYRGLWDTLNAKRGYGWDVSPWVWVYEFERVEQ